MVSLDDAVSDFKQRYGLSDQAWELFGEAQAEQMRLEAEVAALRMKVEGQDLLLRAYRLGNRPPERAFTLLKRADAALAE